MADNFPDPRRYFVFSLHDHHHHHYLCCIFHQLHRYLAQSNLAYHRQLLIAVIQLVLGILVYELANVIVDNVHRNM